MYDPLALNSHNSCNHIDHTPVTTRSCNTPKKELEVSILEQLIYMNDSQNMFQVIAIVLTHLCRLKT